MKKISIICSSLAVLLAVCGCEKELALDTPLFPVEAETDAPKLYFNETGSTTNKVVVTAVGNPKGIALPDDVAFYARLSKPSTQEVTVRVKMGESREGSLPADAFEITQPEVKIPAGSLIAPEAFIVSFKDSETLRNMETGSSLAADFVMEAVSGDAELGRNFNVFEVKVAKTFDELGHLGHIDYSAYALSVTGAMGYGYPISRISSGSASNYFVDYVSSGEGMTILATFNEKVKIQTILFTAATGWYATEFPRQIDISVSSDGETFEDVTSFTREGSVATGQRFIVTLPKTVECSYLKLQIPANRWDTVSLGNMDLYYEK